MVIEEKPIQADNFPIGKVIDNRYQVIDYLGHGSMGLVLKCIDLALENELCVLKILLHNSAVDHTAFVRFKREVVFSRRLAHPNIVKIYDFGQADEQTYYLSMEYIDGESLNDSIARFKPDTMPLEKTLEFLVKAAQALAYAHTKGIIHRDIKPANILISKDFDLKITDFGVAKSIDSAQKLTATDEAIGSPVYMAPEQLNSNTFDHRADIYSFGIMAYELLSGDPPFYSEHRISLVKMHMNDPLPEITEKNNKLPFWIEALVNKCCEKDPENRFQSATEIVDFICEHFDCSKFTGIIKKPGTIQSNLLTNSYLVCSAVLIVFLTGYVALR